MKYGFDIMKIEICCHLELYTVRGSFLIKEDLYSYKYTNFGIVFLIVPSIPNIKQLLLHVYFKFKHF